MKEKLAEYAERFAPVYTLIYQGGRERELTWEEVVAILAHAETEQRGHAVYNVEAVLVAASEETGWERRLWAYRVGDVWTYVPTVFESMTLHWAD